MRRTRCKTCGSAKVAWHLTIAGHWRMYELAPVVFVPDGNGLVKHARDGWLPADSVHPEPPEMLPPHRCPQWSGNRRDPVPVADVLGDLVDLPRRRVRLVRQPGQTG